VVVRFAWIKGKKNQEIKVDKFSGFERIIARLCQTLSLHYRFLDLRCISNLLPESCIYSKFNNRHKE